MSVMILLNKFAIKIDRLTLAQDADRVTGALPFKKFKPIFVDI